MNKNIEAKIFFFFNLWRPFLKNMQKNGIKSQDGTSRQNKERGGQRAESGEMRGGEGESAGREARG
jgi:hypothetical protein